MFREFGLIIVAVVIFSAAFVNYIEHRIEKRIDDHEKKIEQVQKKEQTKNDNKT